MNTIFYGNALDIASHLPIDSTDCVITSPPYYKLRDYGHDRQLGSESTVKEYVDNLCDVFTVIASKLKSTATCFINLGDTYAGSNKGVGGKNPMEQFVFESVPKTKDRLRNKCLYGVPERFMLAMIDRNWILRNKIVWNKPNAKPSECRDKFVPSYEIIYFFTLNPKYYFKKEFEPVKQSTIERHKRGQSAENKYADIVPGQSDKQKLHQGKQLDKDRECPTHRGARDVWDIPTGTQKGIKHFAMFPKILVRKMMEAGCPSDGTVLDPFVGSGTTEIGRAHV